MTDYEISKLVGIRTYCDLYANNPELYQHRPECANFYSDDIHINDVHVLVSENTDMCDLKDDLKYAIQTGCIPKRVKNLIHSSWCYDSVAMSLQYSIIWITIVVIIISIITYTFIASGLIHKILKKNFDPNKF